MAAAMMQVSGLYSMRLKASSSKPTGVLPSQLTSTLRLDVDGDLPQMAASGTVASGLKSRADWMAKLQPSGKGEWSGPIEFLNAVPAANFFPYDGVRIRVSGASPSTLEASVTFSRGKLRAPLLRHSFVSRQFRQVEFEFDTVAGATAVTSIDPTAHPNHAPGLTPGQLSISDVYRRAGIGARETTGASTIPVSSAGADSRWSDQEMHDAMQTYWSRFANRPQWSLWVLFASMHEQGPNLGGVMFDGIGPNHRQGTAIFSDSFISRADPGDPNPAAAVERMRYWTAVHEMGHAFNLAHSWQKALGTGWRMLSNEPEARSPMNYPYRVAGGPNAFFADFEYRFSDQELLFLRHAPERFVQMGNADWFDHHGFEQAAVERHPDFSLTLRANRQKAEFEFLEPVVLELKLKNISPYPKVVLEDLLERQEEMLVIVKREGQSAKQQEPFVHFCRQRRERVLEPNASMYESLFVSISRDGWMVAEPGRYSVQVAVELEGRWVISNAYRLVVRPPKAGAHEALAQDYFSDDVARVLAFDGTRVLRGANDTLKELCVQAAETRAALHARVALGVPATRPYKLLAPDATKTIQAAPLDPELMSFGLEAALRAESAEETLGHVDYRFYIGRLTEGLTELGKLEAAIAANKAMQERFAKRNVLPSVLDEIASKVVVLGKRKAG
jgi:hypothetical protein